MTPDIISAIIGASATILTALIATHGKNLSFILKRKELGYPDIKGEWEATWYVEGKEEPYLIDKVVISKIKGMDIYGEGINTRKGNYPLTGKFSKNLILNFIYESSKNYISLSGVIVLKINPIGNECNGMWYGYTKEDVVTGGKVTWRRLTE